jgi:hypothetical protein
VKNLADIKRRAKVGAVVTLTRHDKLIPERFPIKIGDKRRVAVAQGSGIAFEMPDGGNLSWLAWPKATSVRIIDADTFQVSLTGNGVFEKVMEYRFDKEGE